MDEVLVFFKDQFLMSANKFLTNSEFRHKATTSGFNTITTSITQFQLGTSFYHRLIIIIHSSVYKVPSA